MYILLKSKKGVINEVKIQCLFPCPNISSYLYFKYDNYFMIFNMSLALLEQENIIIVGKNIF